MENQVGKLVCEVPKDGEIYTKVVTTAANTNVGQFVKNMPGVGKRFLYWPTIPPGTVVAADFTNAPIVSLDVAANNAALATMPDAADVLFYA